LTDFQKILKYQISLNPSSGSLVFPCVWTDGHTDTANGRYSQFCKHA